MISLGDLLDHRRLVDGVGDRGDDDLLLAARPGLDLVLAAEADRALPGLVDLAELLLAVQDLAAGREVGALDVLEEILDGELGVVDQRDQRGDDLAQVVRRDVGRHADGDAGRAVHQELRDRARQHDRLVERGVVVGAEGDGVVPEVVEHLLAEGGEARLGVAHRRRAVAVERAEVALALDQRVAQRELLRHAHHRLVGGDVAVRVVLAEHLADDRRRLPRPRTRREVQVLEHRVEDAALDGLQPVAHVGQRARGDDAQRVVEVPLLGGFLEIGFDGLSCGLTTHATPQLPTRRDSARILAGSATKASGIAGTSLLVAGLGTR